MIKSKVIEIVCDGNRSIGFGHIRRARVIADNLKNNGFQVRLVCLSDNASEFYDNKGMIESKPFLTIFDVPYAINNLIKARIEQKILTIAFDWFGAIEPDFNITIYPHEQVRARQKKFIGFEYIILNEDISSLYNSKLSERTEKVLIVIGGGDLLNQGPLAAEFISKLGYDTTLVRGPLSCPTPENNNYITLYDPNDYADLILSTDWAVTNGGTCLFESLCIGRATIALPQTPKELKVAQYINDKGAILGIGIESIRKFSLGEIRETSKRGLKLVDGKGLMRVMSIIRDLL